MDPVKHASFSDTSFVPDRLHAGEVPLSSRKVTLLADEVVVRGEVLGKITAGGKYVASLSAAADGSQTPDAIAAHDVDATGADAEILIYVRGDFNENALTIGAAHTADSIREGLRAKGIFIVPAQSA